MSELRRNLVINGVTYHIAVNQYGSGTPTASTPGKPGVLYMNSDNGTLYKCVSAEDGQFVWELAIPGNTISPVVKTSNMREQVGVDEEGKLWTRCISGCLHYADIAASGASTVTIPLSAISLANSNYNPTFGDKLITNDGYLYEIIGLSVSGGTSYTAKLVCALGGGKDGTGIINVKIQEA